MHKRWWELTEPEEERIEVWANVLLSTVYVIVKRSTQLQGKKIRTKGKKMWKMHIHELLSWTENGLSLAELCQYQVGTMSDH